MDLSYGAELEGFRSDVQSFLKENWPLQGSEKELPVEEQHALFRGRAIAGGYLCRNIPKKYGGSEREPDVMKAAIIREEFNRAWAPGEARGIGTMMLVPTLLERGEEWQKDKWVASTLRGETQWCQGYSEPNAGSDLANVATRGHLDGDEWVVSGQKVWTSLATIAQWCFGVARTEPDLERHKGLSYLLVPMDQPGIEVRPIVQITGGSEFNEVFFDDVRVPLANIVGRRGEGWKIANTTLRHERNMLGSAATSESLYEGVVQVMKDEALGTGAAIESPVLRDRLVELQARTLAMKCHAMRLLTSRLHGESAGVAGLVSKLVGCQLNHDLAGLAIDAMGERGVLYRGMDRARDGGRWQFQYMFQLGLIIGGGTAQIQKNIISERGLGMPREPKAQA